MVAVVTTIGIYVWLFGVQTGAAIFARYKFRGMPDVSMAPVPLTDVSVAVTPHTRVSYFGYQFELPCNDIDEQKSKTVGRIHITAFNSGNALWFSTFPPREFVDDVARNSGLDPEEFRQLYGEQASKSDYGFMQMMLRITPKSISPFSSRKVAVSEMTLLVIKAISMPKADSGIFSIRAGTLQGFQFGDPRSKPFRITEELYDDSGGIDLIFIQKTDGSAPTIRQPEINRIIQSIRKIGPPEAIPSENSAN